MTRESASKVAKSHQPIADETGQRILDAAARLIATKGLSGITLTEVAKEAGVSRPTVYRRWPGTEEIIRATTVQRTASLIERLETHPATKDDIVTGVLRFVALFNSDPLYCTLLEREPEVFITYILQRFGTSQRLSVKWLEEAIATAQKSGSVREGKPSDMALMLVLIGQTVLLSRGIVAQFIGDYELDEELRRAVDGYLRP